MSALSSTKITWTFLERKQRKKITYNYERSDQTLLLMGGFVNIEARNKKIPLFYFFFKVEDSCQHVFANFGVHS